MSVRMVTRFVYVRVCGGLSEVPSVLCGALFGFARACGGGVLQQKLQRARRGRVSLRPYAPVSETLCCGEPLAEGYNNAQNCSDAYAAAG